MRNTLRFVLVLAAILSLGLLLASCGDDPADTTAAVTTTADPAATTTAPVTTAAPTATYKVTFKAGTLRADGTIGTPYTTVAEVTFEEGATSITEPEIPAIAGFIAEWDSYELGKRNLTVNAVYTSLETGTEGLSYEIVTPQGGTAYAEIIGYNGKAERDTVVIPAAYKVGTTSYPVKSIGDLAFLGHPMKNILINGEITSMGKHAFSGCENLVAIVLPNVAEIREYAFFDCHSLASVTVPDSVGTIGKGAFANCYALEAVSFGSGLTTIGESAFAACHSLSSVVIPAGVRNINNRAFLGCVGLESLTVSGTATTLRESVFAGCIGIKNAALPANWLSQIYKANLQTLTVTTGNTIADGALSDAVLLQSVSLPASLTNIGSSVFRGCVSLQTITVDAGNTVFCVEDGILYSKDFTTLYLAPAKISGAITLKSEVTRIHDGAFAHCTGITAITVPSGLKTIGSYAFFGCASLAEVTLPNGTERLGDYAFAGCAALSKINLPISIDEIGDGILSDCMAVTEAKLPAHVALALEKKNLRKLEITSGSFISVKAFYNCENLEEIILADSLTTIGANAFKGTAYYNDDANWTAAAGGKILYINNHLIEAQNITGACTVRADVVNIAASAFLGNSGMTEIALPETVTTIGKDAFKNCTAVTAAAIPTAALSSMPLSALTSIEIISGSIPENAFAGCTLLGNITLGSGVKSIGKNAFNDTAFYQNADKWTDGGKTLYINNCLIVAKTDLTGAYTVRENTALIANDAFNGNTALTSVSFPSSLLYIGNDAFRGCSAVDSIALPAGLLSVGNNAFMGCSVASSVSIPANVTIGKEAFRGCLAIETLLIPATVTSIGENAFADCTALENISVPASVVSSIHKANLVNVTITGGNELPANAFVGSLNLETILLPEGLLSIGNAALSGCAKLTSVAIPASLTTIGRGVFNGCSLLQSITVAAGSTGFSAEEGILYNADKTQLIAIPATKTAYTFPASVTTVADYAFAGTGITAIAIPDTVTAIRGNAFLNCISLQEVSLPAAISGLENTVFAGCTSIKKLTAPTTVLNGSLVTILKGSLEELHINGGGTGGRFTTSFTSCTKLKKLIVDADVTNEFYATAFGACASLETIVAPLNAVKNLPATIKSLTLNGGALTAADISLLNGKTGLQSVVLGADVTFAADATGLFDNHAGITAIFSEGTEPADWATNKWTTKPVYFAGQWSYVAGVPTANPAP